MKVSKIIFILTVIVIISSSMVSSASLWKDKKSIFSDRQAVKEGDLITILIEESSFAATDNTNKRKKDIELGGKTGSDAETDKTFFNSIAKMIPLFGASAKGGSKYESEGEVGKSGTIRAKITVMVKEVDEYGNLQLEGKREILINHEKQNS